MAPADCMPHRYISGRQPSQKEGFEAIAVERTLSIRKVCEGIRGNRGDASSAMGMGKSCKQALTSFVPSDDGHADAEVADALSYCMSGRGQRQDGTAW
jgi:hypothetical protein